jgi:hypothetical protein
MIQANSVLNFLRLQVNHAGLIGPWPNGTPLGLSVPYSGGPG